MIRGSGGSSNEKMHSDYLRVDKISLLSKDLFHGYNTDTHAFSFVTVYINVRQDLGFLKVFLTPFSQGTHLLSVGRLIVVDDQAYHRCVIGKLDDDVGAVCSCTVVCVQGVQEWAEDAALRSTSVEDQGR